MLGEYKLSPTIFKAADELTAAFLPRLGIREHFNGTDIFVPLSSEQIISRP